MSILRVDTISPFSGDVVRVTGELTGSFFGDGGGLYNLPASGLPSGLISSSAQIAGEISGSFVSVSSSIASDIVATSASISTLSGSHLALSSSYLSFTSTYNSGSFSGSFQGDGSQLTGLLTLADFTYRTTITGSALYNITHSLNEEYPVVQVYDTSTKKQVIPKGVESIDQNVVRVTFTTTFNGLAIIKK